jgi:Sigma-70 region 2
LDEKEWLAERFEENRTHLWSVAYRMLGSLAEAEDAVQESWLRLSRTDADRAAPVEAVLIVELVDIRDGVAAIDERHCRKQLD